MGLLKNGKWMDQWYDTKSSGGRFEREPSQFRNWITADGSPGTTGNGGFKSDIGRYHLYVSLACPWASRTLIFRSIKGLKNIVSISVVHWNMSQFGWTFQPAKGTTPDNINKTNYLYQLYTKAQTNYSGRVTVPVLWDKKTKTIVSNESSEIIRMFNSEFNEFGADSTDYYPENLRAEIDDINERVYNNLNNGVYKAGFATTQEAYENSVFSVFETLDWLEEKLSTTRFLTGDRITEADWRLFTTLIRFDAVYVGHFKCNLRRIADYQHLSGYLCDLYQQPGVSETVDMEHIKRHYYCSHETINPSKIVPTGPELNLKKPHGRERIGKVKN